MLLNFSNLDHLGFEPSESVHQAALSKKLIQRICFLMKKTLTILVNSINQLILSLL